MQWAILYVYTLPIGDIIHEHKANFYLMYVDKTQLHLTCKIPTEPVTLTVTLAKLRPCIVHIQQWIPQIRLKLNNINTVFLVLQSKNILSPPPFPDICGTPLPGVCECTPRPEYVVYTTSDEDIVAGRTGRMEAVSVHTTNV